MQYAPILYNDVNVDGLITLTLSPILKIEPRQEDNILLQMKRVAPAYWGDIQKYGADLTTVNTEHVVIKVNICENPRKGILTTF